MKLYDNEGASIGMPNVGAIVSIYCANYVDNSHIMGDTQDTLPDTFLGGVQSNFTSTPY